MGRRRRSARLTVALNGRVVGSLTRAADGATRFDYDQDWLAWPHALPVSRSMPLMDRPFTGLTVRAVFDNLLPDEAVVRERIAARVGAEGADAFSLLAALGRDCVGALQFLPEGEPPAPPGPPVGTPLTDAEIAQRLRDLATAPLGLAGRDGAFRLSLAGVQEKTALLYHNGQWLEPEGSTPTTHILKPPIGMVRGVDGSVDMTQSVVNEHLCLRLCRALGLPVAESEIVHFDGLPVLSVTRFDRVRALDGRLLRRPQEDMCQALGMPPTQKYEADGGPGIGDCLDLLRSSDQPDEDRALFLKAQLVFWLIGAIDGHGKNFSLHLSPGGRYRLAPLYDVLSTQMAHDQGQIRQRSFCLSMAVGDNRHTQPDRIAPRHFAQTAQRHGLPAATVRQVMKELVTAMPGAATAMQAEITTLGPAQAAAGAPILNAILTASQKRAHEIEQYAASNTPA